MPQHLLEGIHHVRAHFSIFVLIHALQQAAAWHEVHENHHLWSKTRIGLAKPDGQYELVYETADLMEPDPFPEGYQ